MPITLTESPNPLLLQTASLPPSGSWITSPFFPPFPATLGTSEPPPLSVYIPPSPSLSPLLFLPHSTNPHALKSSPLSYVFQSFILVFPPPWEYSLHISSAHSHRLLSWCNSLADIPCCTYQSLSPPHSYIVYSKLPMLP